MKNADILDENDKKPEDKKIPIEYRTLLFLSMLPILIWPFVAMSLIMLFSNFPDSKWVNILFYILLAYPLILLGNLVLGLNHYSQNKIQAYLIVLWPYILLFGVYIISVFANIFI